MSFCDTLTESGKKGRPLLSLTDVFPGTLYSLAKFRFHAILLHNTAKEERCPDEKTKQYLGVNVTVKDVSGGRRQIKDGRIY